MRTFHYDATANAVYATDHPSVRAHLLRKGCKVLPASTARQYTRPVGSHPFAHGARVALLNANWRA